MVINDIATSTHFEEACSRFHYETRKYKALKKIGLQCLYTIPQCPTFLHDDQIDFNKNKNVFRALDVNPTSEIWFLNKYIYDEIKRKSRKKREDNLQVMKWHMILDNT